MANLPPQDGVGFGVDLSGYTELLEFEQNIPIEGMTPLTEGNIKKQSRFERMAEVAYEQSPELQEQLGRVIPQLQASQDRMDAMPDEKPWKSEPRVMEQDQDVRSEPTTVQYTSMGASSAGYLTAGIDTAANKVVDGLSKIRNQDAAYASMVDGRPWQAVSLQQAGFDIQTPQGLNLPSESSAAIALGQYETGISTVSKVAKYIPGLSYGAAAVEVAADTSQASLDDMHAKAKASATAVVLGEAIEAGGFMAGSALGGLAVNVAIGFGATISAPLALGVVAITGVAVAVGAGAAFSDEWFIWDHNDSPSSKLKDFLFENQTWQSAAPNPNYKTGMSPSLMSAM